jgi:hypothetical protein
MKPTQKKCIHFLKGIVSIRASHTLDPRCGEIRQAVQNARGILSRNPAAISQVKLEDNA